MARIEPDGVAQDPAELFDVVRANGKPTGEVKTRADVHRDGDWHRSIHVWIAGESLAGRFLLVQRRGLQKDTWPGKLDATVGGHYRHGERLADALREVEEEIGVAVDERHLLRLGIRLCASEEEPGILDREIQDVFLLIDNRPLTDFSPNPDELDSLVKLPIEGVFALFTEEADVLRAEAILPGSNLIEEVILRLEDFIPTIDRYFYKIAVAADRVMSGYRHVVV